MQNLIEKSRTATHEFYIQQVNEGAFRVEYRALHPKHGTPWQASKYCFIDADVQIQGYWDRPIAFSTLELARAAVEAQKAKLAKRRPFAA